MADLTQNEKLNLAYKIAFLIQGTSNTDDSLGREWFEESYPWAPLLVSKDVFIDNVPYAAVGQGDTIQAANPAIISKIDISLTKKNGYNGRLWAAHSVYNDENSTIYENFLIPVKFGPGFTARLYQDDGGGGIGDEITTTEGAWIFAYKAGLLILGAGHTATDEGWTEPLHLVGYRYIGQTVANIAGSAISLDDAYDNGRIITVDNGPVELDATPGANAYAPLRLNNLANAPTSSLAAGDIAVVDGRIYAYDGTRSKWLSVQRDKIIFNKRLADGQYLSLASDFISKYVGFICHYDSTIVGITAKADGGALNKTIRLRRNGTTSNLASFALSGGFYSSLTEDISLNQSDILQVFADPDGTGVKNIIVQIELAYRV